MPRADGRAHNELRPVSMATGYNKYAEGSCLIELGDTVVICTASVLAAPPGRSSPAAWHNRSRPRPPPNRPAALLPGPRNSCARWYDSATMESTTSSSSSEGFRAGRMRSPFTGSRLSSF